MDIVIFHGTFSVPFIPGIVMLNGVMILGLSIYSGKFQHDDLNTRSQDQNVKILIYNFIIDKKGHKI